MGLAIFAGALIGWEREAAEKPAGLRTHMLVSFGSAMFVLTSIQTGAVEQSADVLSRVMQGVIAGIGFLGAGEIFSTTRSDSDQIRVKGLTSAAAIWVSASLGVVMGCGLWQLGLLGAGMTFLILWGVKKFER
nr:MULTISPECIES: MgtC/SapB family protein [unclassified Leptolyngbya]